MILHRWIKTKDQLFFDDMLGARNSSKLDVSFTRGRHENLDVYYISQNYFVLPRQSIRNNSDRIILFQQSLRDVESIDRDIGANDMESRDFKQMCRNAWNGKCNYLYIDITRDEREGNYHIFNESKNTNFECFCETEAL